MKEQGKVTLPDARIMVIEWSSSGWRRTSVEGFENSGSSSRKRTPLCASEISPGMGIAPPPASATGESVWCGDLNGLDVTSETPSGSIPATEWSFVVPIASSKESGGSIVGIRFASILFPVPGEPIIRILCPPAAAISSARFALSCPLTSAKSSSKLFMPFSNRLMSKTVGSILLFPVRWSIISRTFLTP